MKKISFVLMALALATTVSAQSRLDHDNNLNPFAYGINPQVKNAKVGLAYQLNAPATATEIVIYCNGEEVGTQTVDENAAGLHSAVVDLSSYTTAGTYTLGIRVHGDATRTVAEQLGTGTGSDFVPAYYSFWHSKAVVTDNNPFSPNFGRIIATAGMNDVTGNAAYWDGEGAGLYAFDPSFAPIPNGNNRSYKGGEGVVFPTGAQNYENVGQYGPNRLALTKDGSRLFVSQTEVGTGLVQIYEVSADLQTWTPYVRTAAPLGEAVLSNIGITVVGDGADAKVISLEGTADGRYCSTQYAENLIIRQYTGAADAVVATDLFAGEAMAALCTSDEEGLAGTNFYIEQSQLAASEEGYWISTGRGAGAQLIHVNAEGVRDYIGAGNFAGGGACFEHDGKLYMSRPSHTVAVFTIGADATGAPTLTEDYTFQLEGIGNALNNFAVDYANNFYAVGNYGEMLVAAMLPYSGVVETPVDAEVVIEGSAVENVEAAPVVEKLMENGQLVIVKDGIRYNALGARL